MSALFFLFCFVFVFSRHASLYSPGTHSVDQAGLELRNPSASASQVLGLKAYTTMPSCLLFVVVVWFYETAFLCSPGYPGTHSIDQAALKLRNLPASAFQVLGLKACSTTAWI